MRCTTAALAADSWSSLVCFAGLGPGEVMVAGRKAVGLSQRRSREGARFQSALLHRWEPHRLLALLALSGGERATAGADLAGTAGEIHRARRRPRGGVHGLAAGLSAGPSPAIGDSP